MKRSLPLSDTAPPCSVPLMDEQLDPNEQRKQMDRADLSFLHVKPTKAQKRTYVRAALSIRTEGRPMKLEDWVLQTLDAEVKRMTS